MKVMSQLLVGTALLWSGTAFAQQAASTPQAKNEPSAIQQEAGSSDIIVTAQRRAERVQDVPIAVAIVSGDQLDRQQVTQLSELSRTTASLQINASGGGPGGSSAFIRGIGTTALTRSAESAVGVVVDGVVQGNTNIANLFDIARVEVLRGPQGTLFGQSVSAGVINITTEAPDPSRMSGRASIQLAGDDFAGSEFGRQVLRGTVNVPVSENSAIRASVFGSRINGITNNTYTGRADELTELGWRARYQGRFGDRLTVNIIGDYNYSKGTDGQFFELTNVSGPENQFLAQVCGIVAQPGNLKHCSSSPERQIKRVWGVSGQFDLDLGGFTLTSITARRFQELDTNGDIDRLPRPPALLNVQSGVLTKYGQFTQEVRLSSDPGRPLQATIGGFYQDADTLFATGPQYGAFTFLDFIPGGLIASTDARAINETKSISGFGEARYKTGPLTVFAGGRYTHAKLTLDSTQRSALPVQTPLLIGRLNYSDNDISWRAGAQLEPVRDVMIYGTASRGYKNAQLAPIQIVNNTPILGSVVQPEKPMAYEIGIKSTFFGGRLAVNVDGFYQRVKNFQTQTAYRDPVSQVINAVPINIDRVITKGIEGDIFGRIGRNFTINGSAIYNVAKYPGNFLALDGTSLGGRQIAFAPRFSATLSGEYSVLLSGRMQGFLSLDGQYRSRTLLSTERSDSIISDKERWIFGGRVGVRMQDGWSVNAYVSNIGASRIASAIAGLAAQPGSAYAFATAYSPQSLRQIGLQASLSF